MRRNFIPALSLVQRDHVLVVDGQTPVWVDGDAEQARIGLQITRRRRRLFIVYKIRTALRLVYRAVWRDR